MRQARSEAAGSSTAVRLWGPYTLLSLGIAAALLAVLASRVDLQAVARNLASCDRRLVLLGLLAHYATYPVRGLRWRRCLQHVDARGSGGLYGLLVFFYNAVDNVVPAKLGDLYAAHLARINLGVRRSTALGSVAFVRMLDAWVVLLLAVASSWIVFAERLPSAVSWTLLLGAVLALGITGAIALLFLLRGSLPTRLPEAVRTRLAAFQSGIWPRSSELLAIAGLTGLIWVLEMAWLWLLTVSLGVSLEPAEVVFLTMVPLLASAFPLTPSGAGVVELTLYGCLRALSVVAPTAASLTVLNRFIDYWLHIGLGLVVWVFRGRLGLRTWRDVPLERSEADEPPQDWLLKRA